MSESQTQTQPWIQDASPDRQPGNSFVPSEEDFQRIMEQTNDSRFQIMLANSPTQHHLLVGRLGSRPRYVLVHSFLRKWCNESRKWSWLIQWMI